MSGTFKDKGLVIREYPAGEQDKRLTLLLLDRGRTTVFVKGAAKTSSKFHASAQLFAFSDFVLYEGNGFITLSQSSLVDNFFGVFGNFERLCCASHVVELADRMLLPAMPCRNELMLIYMALERLARAPDKTASMLLAAAFELKFFQLEGFQPAVGACSHCDTPLPGKGFFTASGMTCPDCAAREAEKAWLSEAAAFAVNYIINAEIKDVFKFKVTEKAQGELSRALRLFRSGVLDAPPNSLTLLEDS